MPRSPPAGLPSRPRPGDLWLRFIYPQVGAYPLAGGMVNQSAPSSAPSSAPAQALPVVLVTLTLRPLYHTHPSWRMRPAKNHASWLCTTRSTVRPRYSLIPLSQIIDTCSFTCSTFLPGLPCSLDPGQETSGPGSSIHRWVPVRCSYRRVCALIGSGPAAPTPHVHCAPDPA